MSCQQDKLPNHFLFLFFMNCYQELQCKLETRFKLKSEHPSWYSLDALRRRGHSLVKFVDGELGLLGVESRVSE